MTLDQDVTFAFVPIGGTPLSAGFHSFAGLNSAFDVFFTDGGGGITVSAIPEPSDVAAHVDSTARVDATDFFVVASFLR